ncbi:CAP domain-containing protein [Cytobacillus sp. Hm23]
MITCMVLLVTCMPRAADGRTMMYKVQPGDSLWEIAVLYNIKLSLLIKENPQFPNPNIIFPGQVVYIPINDVKTNIEDKIIQLTNAERSRNGLQPLKVDPTLSSIARTKSSDMRDKNYFSHISPTYGSVFNMLRAHGVHFHTGAENIAVGHSSAEEVVKFWMNNSGHRANVLNHDMTHIGVGYTTGGSYGHYWTQILVQK